SHLFTTPSIWNVKLTVTTNSPQSCSNTITQAVRVGSLPDVNFKWSSICTNDSTSFNDLTTLISPSSITNYTWDFGDGHSVSGANGQTMPVGTDGGFTSGSFKNPNHKYATNTNYTAQLTIDTNDGCSSSLPKNLFTLAYTTVFPLPAAAYFEPFDISDGGWKVEAISNPADPISWQWGPTNGAVINSGVAGSTNAWWTGAHVPASSDSTTYYPDEQTVVNGPCFDLSQLKRPMISFDYWVDTQKDFDGTVLQYSVNGGNTWRNIGVPDAGINWYTKDQIIANPGGQSVGQYGWTGQSGTWLNARANLDTIPGSRKQVRIRIAFGSEATTPPAARFEGFAFDNVFVGEKTRNVLVEHFTNSKLNASNSADQYLDNLYSNGIALRGASDFYDIRYHVSYPSSDQLNQDNPADPAARALFFGVAQPPFTIMDGRLDASFKGNYLEISRVEVDRRALSDPGFDLALTSSGTGNKITVQLDITALAALNVPLIAQVALVEKSVGSANKVLRKQLFGSDGETINVSWAKGHVESVLKTDVEINVPITNPGQLMLVAYVQNKNTKEIYQSLVVPAPSLTGATITGIGEPTSSGSIDEIQLFPNPANGEFWFGLPGNFPSGNTWSISDQRGIGVLSGDFTGAVGGQKSVNVAGLPSGVYFVVIRTPEKGAVYRKLVIMNRN
ncbi:MAG TPA: T9SS type A sorting domain-containing protein, partial [Cyclobacteriaceae bacterium]|nr:T9SS type A sorting domain-containing protein [Cyclobacteriaceae bacterium]